MAIVAVNVPTLLGLDVLDSENLCAGNVTNRLLHCNFQSRPSDEVEYKDVWSLPISRHDAHLYSRKYFPT